MILSLLGRSIAGYSSLGWGALSNSVTYSPFSFQSVPTKLQIDQTLFCLCPCIWHYKLPWGGSLSWECTWGRCFYPGWLLSPQPHQWASSPMQRSSHRSLSAAKSVLSSQSGSSFYSSSQLAIFWGIGHKVGRSQSLAALQCYQAACSYGRTAHTFLSVSSTCYLIKSGSSGTSLSLLFPVSLWTPGKGR